MDAAGLPSPGSGSGAAGRGAGRLPRAERGWYVNYNTAADAFVVFADRVFRYPRGDPAGRAEVAAYGRGIGIPESQLDWED